MSNEVISTPLIEEIIENVNVKKTICLADINSFEGNNKYFNNFRSLFDRCLSSNKEGIANIRNHEFFIYMFLRRNKSDVMDYEAAVNLFKPYFRVIDSWDYDVVSSKITKLCNHYVALNADDNRNRTRDILSKTELRNILDSLGLNPEFVSYDLCDIFYSMECLLQFKKDIKDIKNGTYVGSNKVINLGSKFLNPIDPLEFMKKMPMKQNKDVLYNLTYDNRLKRIIDFYSTELEEEYNTALYNYQIVKQSLEVLKKYDSPSKLVNFYEIDEDYYSCVYDESGELDCLLMRQIMFNIASKYENDASYAESLSHKINKSELTTYLYKRGINPDSIPNLSKYEEKEDIIAILNFLEEMGINSGTALLSYSKVIDLLDLDLINKIGSILKSGAISFKFLINNYEFVLGNIDSLNEKISLLSDYIRFDDNKVYDENLLLNDFSDIKNRLLIIGQYECLNKSRKLQTYLLCNIEYINILDLMLENDIPLNLLMQICKSKSPIDTVKKIILCKRLDIKYMKGMTLSNDVTVPGRFYGNDLKLDTLLDNYSNIFDKSFNSIPEGYSNESILGVDDVLMFEGDCYTNGDIKISRPKFLRNYYGNGKDNIIACLCSGSILSKSQVDLFIHDLNPNQIGTK